MQIKLSIRGFDFEYNIYFILAIFLDSDELPSYGITLTITQDVLKDPISFISSIVSVNAAVKTSI